MKKANSKVAKNKNSKVYPFVDQLVDTLYCDNINNIINDKIQTDMDKSIFMMFVLMYFVVNIKLQSAIDNQQLKSDNVQTKEHIKNIMTHIIADGEKRKACLQMFESYFRQFFNKNATVFHQKLKIEGDLTPTQDNTD